MTFLVTTFLFYLFTYDLKSIMFILNINNMAVNDYLRECKYNLNNLDNYIYLYEFDEPILNYITDDAESNGSSINLKRFFI